MFCPKCFIFSLSSEILTDDDWFYVSLKILTDDDWFYVSLEYKGVHVDVELSRKTETSDSYDGKEGESTATADF